MASQFRLLVVDDDREIREALRTALEDQGFTVAVAANGAEAIQKMAERPPRMVLLDLMMPVLDGWEVLEHMREDPELATVPVCVLSALTGTPPPRADFALRKPFKIEALLNLVAAVA
jgi:CheY-like chemotaxis protein